MVNFSVNQPFDYNARTVAERLFYTKTDGITQIRWITRKLFAYSNAFMPHDFNCVLVHRNGRYLPIHSAVYFRRIWSKCKSMNKPFPSFWQLILSLDGLFAGFRGTSRNFYLQTNEWKWSVFVPVGIHSIHFEFSTSYQVFKWFCIPNKYLNPFMTFIE